MDSQLVTVDQLASAIASVQEAIANLGQRIDGQQARQAPIQEDAQFDPVPPPPPPPISQFTPSPVPFVLHSQTEVAPPLAIAPTPTTDDTQARMEKLEQRMRQLRTSEGLVDWDDFDGTPTAGLPAKFKIPEMERYSGVGCPRIHLKVYSTLMRAHSLDESQMFMLFPLSLSGIAQKWYVSLDISRRRTWDDLTQEFLRQFSFNTVIDVSRRELEALRQRPDETVTSFISRWREKILQIIDRPSERDQITMFVRSLQPCFARHLMGSRHTDFETLLLALYDIEEGISRGLWVESSPSDPKGKRPLGGPRSDVGAISTYRPRPPRYQQTYQQPFQQSFRARSPYAASSQYQLRSPVPPQTYDQTYLYSALPQPCYAAQAFDRPPGIYARPRAPQAPTVPAPRPQRQFSQLGMPLSQAFRKLVDAGLLTPLAPRPLPQFLSPQFRVDLHCLYHQGPGHDRPGFGELGTAECHH